MYYLTLITSLAIMTKGFLQQQQYEAVIIMNPVSLFVVILLSRWNMEAVCWKSHLTLHERDSSLYRWNKRLFGLDMWLALWFWSSTEDTARHVWHSQAVFNYQHTTESEPFYQLRQPLLRYTPMYRAHFASQCGVNK